MTRGSSVSYSSAIADRAGVALLVASEVVVSRRDRAERGCRVRDRTKRPVFGLGASAEPIRCTRNIWPTLLPPAWTALIDRAEERVEVGSRGWVHASGARTLGSAGLVMCRWHGVFFPNSVSSDSLRLMLDSNAIVEY